MSRSHDSLGQALSESGRRPTSAASLRVAFFGPLALRLLRGTNEIAVRVQLPEDERKELHSLEDLAIRTPSVAPDSGDC